MAKIHCPQCFGKQVFESRFVIWDILFIPIGFPKRCNHCNTRFRSWISAEKRSSRRDKPKEGGSGDVDITDKIRPNRDGETS